MNSNVLAKTNDMDRVEWLEWRRKGLGGSDVGAICGLNKWKSPVAIYLDKIGELPPDDQQSESAYWGTVLEEVVANEFETRTDKKVRRKNAMLQHPEYPWMLANVDRLVVGEKALLECKTTSAYNSEEWQNDKVPESYILQVQHYLAVSGLQKAYIACLVGGNKYIWKEIERDEDIINYLIEIEKDFWENHVEKKVPPAIDGSDSSSELLKQLYPESVQDSQVQLSTAAEDLIIKRKYFKEQIEELETNLNECENKLKEMLQNSEIGMTDNYKVTWKSISSNRIDSKALKNDYPDIYKKYSKESSYRKFSIKELNGGK